MVSGGKHILEIDFLRGFAILAVIAIHTTAAFTDVPYIDSLVITNIVIDVFSQFAVPLFIFISGFVLYLKYNGKYSLKHFYKNRFLRIIPPYLIFTTIYLFYLPLGYALVYGNVPVYPSILEIVSAFLFAGGYFHLWFFLIIIELYLFYPLLEKIYAILASRGFEWAFLLGAFLLQIGWGVVSAFFPVSLFGNEIYIMNKVLFCQIFYFILGMCVCKHYVQIKSLFMEKWITNITSYRIPLYGFLLILISLLTALSSYGLILGLKIYGSYLFIPPTYFIPYTIIQPFAYVLTFIVLFIISTVLVHAGTCKILSIIGTYSFGIYLIHPLIQGILGRTFSVVLNLGATDVLYYPLMFSLTLLLSGISIHILHKFSWSKYVIG